MRPISKNTRSQKTSSKSNVNCSVYGCKAIYRKNPELTYHRVPPPGDQVWYHDEFGNKNVVERRHLWESRIAMGRSVSSHMRVCSRHFTNEDYLTPNEDCHTMRRLKKASIPSQNLPVASLSNVSYHEVKQQQGAQTRLPNRKNELEENLLDNNFSNNQEFDSQQDIADEPIPNIASKVEIVEEPEDEIFHIIATIRNHHQTFQSSKSGCAQYKNTLSKIKTKEQWEAFLCLKSEENGASEDVVSTRLFVDESDYKNIKVYFAL